MITNVNYENLQVGEKKKSPTIKRENLKGGEVSTAERAGKIRNEQIFFDSLELCLMFRKDAMD